jgi:hypothetical protein
MDASKNKGLICGGLTAPSRIYRVLAILPRQDPMRLRDRKETILDAFEESGSGAV